MDIFDLDIKDFEKEIDNFLKGYTPEELLEELKQCGLQVEKEANK